MASQIRAALEQLLPYAEHNLACPESGDAFTTGILAAIEAARAALAAPDTEEVLARALVEAVEHVATNRALVESGDLRIMDAWSAYDVMIDAARALRAALEGSAP